MSSASAPGRWVPTRSEIRDRPRPVARLLDEIRALDRAYSPGHHGRWSASRRAELVDRCLEDLFRDADAPAGVSVAALGGYGRSQLAPGSDIDLLILHGGGGDSVERLAERLLYPLWDAGLTVGHAVRTPDECEVAAQERLDTWTALLDARCLAGDERLFAEMRSRIRNLARKDPRAIAERLRDDARRRRERHGAVSSLLEPDLRDGAGGLRDIQSLTWLAAVAGGDGESDSLVLAGLIRAREREAIDEAEEFLVRVRSAIHLQVGRRIDRLYLEQQTQVASAMGFEDEPGLPAVDGLMRAIFEHARQVEHVSGGAFDRFLGSEPTGSDSADLQPTAEGVMAAFAHVAWDARALSPELLDRIESVPLEDPIPWTEGMRSDFLRLLRAGPGGARALEAMDRIDVLGRFLPEWRPIRCRPQRDPYHRYSVDVHLLETIARMARLLDGSLQSDRVAVEAAAALSDPDAVLLGALLHDIGKNGEGSHVSIGIRLAASALERMGLEKETRDLALFMVEHHLLLSNTATRRDLADDDLVTDVAGRIGEPERLAALYLLTVADAEATGPLAWTPWRAALVRELVAKVQHVLESGEVGVETAERLGARALGIRQLLAREDSVAVERFLVRMPRAYLLSMSPEQAAVHFPLVSPPIGALEVRTLSGPGTRPGVHAVTVVAADRPGLLSWIAGAFSLAGLSILTAQVFTTEDGVAVDVFEVEGAFEPEIGEERWREFRNTLRRTLEGRLSLEYRVNEKRKYYPPPRADIPVRVTIDNGASDFFTVVEVGAADRIGLLFDITRTLAELQLDVHLAKVATYGARVIDAFYVRDVLGRKVEDPEHVAELEGALRARLVPRASP